MNRKKRIIVLLCLAVAIIAAAGYGFYRWKQHTEGLSGLTPIDHPTDGPGFAVMEVPQADPLIVGKWQNMANPKWYKMYFDDFDEDEKLFWGKEWNEAEDVTEEDLKYHGNGWFRWEKKGDVLREYATMDVRDVPIYKAYKILLSTSDSLVYNELDYKKNIYRFSRVVY